MFLQLYTFTDCRNDPEAVIMIMCVQALGKTSDVQPPTLPPLSSCQIQHGLINIFFYQYHSKTETTISSQRTSE